jgi:hypothetical protein
MKIKRKDVTVSKRDINKKIKDAKKTRKRYVKGLEKMFKKKMVEDARSKKRIDMEERKLRKTLRKQEGYKEEIKHELLNNLVSKYRAKIMDDLVTVDEEMHAKEREKQEKERLKEIEKQKKIADKKHEMEEKKKKREHEKQTKKAAKDKERAAKKAEKEKARKTKKAHK